MQDDSDATKGRRAGRTRGRKKSPPITGHPPIIITDALDNESLRARTAGRNMVLRFDGGGHYSSDGSTVYRARSLKNITSVQVSDGLNPPHICPGVPPDCEIVVTGSKGGSGDAQIVVRGDRGASGDRGIKITFDRGEYRHESTAQTRRKFRGELRKVKSMVIKNSLGAVVHTCEAVSESKLVHISICDECKLP